MFCDPRGARRDIGYEKQSTLLDELLCYCVTWIACFYYVATSVWGLEYVLGLCNCKQWNL